MTRVVTIEYDDEVPVVNWFDSKSKHWIDPPHHEYNWLYLHTQQTLVNDLLRARGHVFLNEVYDLLGLPRTDMGAVVGWTYENPASFINFGCWKQEQQQPLDPENPDAIRLVFNVQGPILSALR